MRDEIINSWLAQQGFSGWARQAVATDASARGYVRLKHPTNGSRMILMDAPNETCGSLTPFIRIAELLRQHDLAAPEIHSVENDLGLMLLEDLGPVDVASHLRQTPSDEGMIYQSAVSLLQNIQAIPAPDGLLKFTPQQAADMLAPFFEHYDTTLTEHQRADIQTHLKDVFEQNVEPLMVLSLRDFHAENLIWRSDKPARYKLGLLDFQDAFCAHPAYDLVSLLNDARRDVSADVCEAAKRQFCGQTHTDAETFERVFAILSFQRNMRILGIFARLVQDMGKEKYRPLMPRVAGYVRASLRHPVLSGIRPILDPVLSNET